MRDFALLAFLVIVIPFILKRPWIGILVGAWISLMSPHRYAWGFAYNIPFAFIVAVVTVSGLVFGKHKIEFPRHPIMYMLLVLMTWFSVTTVFALEFDAAMYRWQSVMKVFLLIALSGFLIRTREQIIAFVWVLVFSVGWFGVKGGIFTILTGGGHRVYGPAGGSFISDNNAISIALIMVDPADVLPELDGRAQD